MWEPNEQLLMRAPVLYKKHEGTLFVTPRRVAWQQQGSSQLTPSIYYKDIQGMAQTAATAAKVLLKISSIPPITKDYTFQFTSLKAIQERESIKSQIAELLARVRGLSSAAAIGTPNPITPSGMGSPSPSTPQSPVATPNPAYNNNNHNGNVPSPMSSLQQQAAIAGSPRSPNGNMGSPTTTSPGGNSPRSGKQEEFADRKKLLTSHRELQTLHKELVVFGKSVDEEEFWSSPYIKRIRQKLKLDAVSREGKEKGKSSRMVELKPGQQDGSEIKYTLTSQIIHNIFTEFPSVKRAFDANVPDKMPEQAFWKRFLASQFFHKSRTGARSHSTKYDDIFDMCLQEEDDENSRPPIDRMNRIRFDIDLSSTLEDHASGGNAPDFTMKPGREAQSLPLIRRFNRHSARVLETPTSKSKYDEVTDQDVEKDIIINDLMDEAPSERIVLDIQDTRRYFESQTGGQDTLKVDEQDTKNMLSGYKRRFEGWQPEMAKQAMNSKAADKVCHELSITIKKKAGHDNRSESDFKLLPVVQQKLQNYHSATNEILRHFWASWEPYRPDKNLRMVEGLRKQQQKLSELFKAIEQVDGRVDICKQTLLPLLQAVDRAMETSQKRSKKK